MENITVCVLDSQGHRGMNRLYADLPKTYVDTASSGGGSKSHEASGVALANYEDFICTISSSGTS